VKVFPLFGVNGHEVMDVLGIQSGPRAGQTLNQFLDLEIEKRSRKNNRSG